MEKLLTAPVLALLVLPSMAEATKTSMGDGAVSCGTWSANRSHRSVRTELEEAWVLGMLSGLNSITHAEDVLADADAEGIYGAMDQECLKNPLEGIGEAVFPVMNQLLARAHSAARRQ